MTSRIISLLDSFTGLDQLIMDPACHDVLSIFKGMRNGFVYGARLRFSHAIVMAILFRGGTTWRAKLQSAVKAARAHGTSLSTYVGIYKTVLYFLNLLRTHKVAPVSDRLKASLDPLIAGLIGGYYVFGRPTAKAAGSGINQQIVLYIFSRVCLAIGQMIELKMFYNTSNTQVAKQARLNVAKPATASVKHNPPRHRILGMPEGQLVNITWAVFASVNWGLVMYFFAIDPKILQSSLARSMDYLYLDSNHWTSLSDFLTK